LLLLLFVNVGIGGNAVVTTGRERTVISKERLYMLFVIGTGKEHSHVFPVEIIAA
jgi:hypothetical protein